MESLHGCSTAHRDHEPGACRSADFQVCCVAGFQTGGAFDSSGVFSFGGAADLEVGDTAGLETCATTAWFMERGEGTRSFRLETVSDGFMILRVMARRAEKQFRPCSRPAPVLQDAEALFCLGVMER